VIGGAPTASHVRVEQLIDQDLFFLRPDVSARAFLMKWSGYSCSAWSTLQQFFFLLPHEKSGWCEGCRSRPPSGKFRTEPAMHPLRQIISGGQTSRTTASFPTALTTEISRPPFWTLHNTFRGITLIVKNRFASPNSATFPRPPAVHRRKTLCGSKERRQFHFS